MTIKMNKDTNSNIREQIIIPDDHNEKFLKNLSDIELAISFSKNENNFKIFKKLLLKLVDKNTQLNKLLDEIIYREHVKY